MLLRVLSDYKEAYTLVAIEAGRVFADSTCFYGCTMRCLVMGMVV